MKRRFIRQNREIARVNSNQSIRIRNLETEISRLLAENIALREDAIDARAEADKWKASHKLNKEVLRMKEQLELKLSEVSDLVGELGVLPEKVARRSSQRRRQGGLVSELVRSGEERETRQRHTIFEQEGRLPAILEDKYHPRRTLETTEIHVLAQEENNEATESPDLGPPPVTHFDETEAVTFNAARSPRRTSSELIEESERGSKTAFTSVDSRRKRRTSVLLDPSAVNEMAVNTAEEAVMVIPEPQKNDMASQPRPILKTGAKRKLEMSELEDTSKVSKELDDFIFQRKANSASVPSARQSRFSRPLAKPNHQDGEPLENRSPERSTQPARKILAPKSTNSPAKRRVVTSSEKQDVAKDDALEKRPERRIVSRIRTKAAVVDPIDTQKSQSGHPRSEGDTKITEAQVHLDPKTPAPDMDDVMSPTSTEPSTKQRLPREMAVTNSVEDVLNGSIGRGSRRARAPVNYAQPNLRDKMRRPGKELVGAVEGLVKSQNELDQDKSRSRSNSTGVERARDGKSEPASPLRDKIAPAPRKSGHEAEGAEDDINSAISRLSLLDALKSSPANGGSDNVPPTRHQSIHPPSTDDSVALSGLSTIKQRRSSSAASIRQPTNQDEVGDSQRKGHVRKAASVTSLPPASQLSHRRPASSWRSNIPTEPADPEIQDSRTRSSALMV